jgi:hypothetical protein
LKPIHYVSLIIGFGWFAASFYLVVSNTILRDTPIGVVATFLERLPVGLSKLIFIVFWITALFGWLILIGLGVTPLFRRRITG